MGPHRKPARRRIKTHRNYTVEEAARVLGVCKATVRRWLKSGLPAITDRKPTLILGADLIDYLGSRSAPKRRCQPHECFCLKCRAPRAPALNMVEYLPLTSSTGNLRALCCECGSIMHKAISFRAMEALKTKFCETAPQATEHLMDTSAPSLDVHLPEEPETDA